MDPQFNRYSQHARRSLTQSHLFARHYGHAEVDTDHVLVGMLGTDGSLGWRVLNDLGVDYKAVQAQVRTRHAVIHPDTKRLPFSQSLREALIVAVSEARSLGSDYIGTEHILLGLLQNGGGQLWSLLDQLQLTTEQIRSHINDLVQAGSSEIKMEAVRRMTKLSELGKRVLTAAEQVATEHQQRTISPEHLLLVLSRERRSVAKRLLSQANCDVARLEEVIPALPPYAALATTRLDLILDTAVQQAQTMGSHYTGTEHILLAMTLLPWSQQMLQTYGIDIQQLQKLLHEALDS